MARVLAIDIGTSSVRATLYGRGLRPVRDGAHVKYRWRIGHDGSVETSPATIERAIVRAIDAALERQRGPVDAVGIAAFWHSLMGVDAHGRPVTAVLPWTDTRSAQEVEALRGRVDERAVHARTGCRLHSTYWPARLQWFRDHDRKAFRGVRTWMSFPAYLERRWLGRHAESLSQASGTGLFVHKDGHWDAELCEACGIDPGRLPRIVDLDDREAEPSSAIAKRWPQLRAARWVPPAGDGAANDVGAGCTADGRTALMIGTSGALRQIWTTEVEPKVPFGLWRYWLDRRRVVVGGALSNGGNLVAWMRQTLALEDGPRLERELLRMRPDAHNLTVLPFLAGERSPDYLPDARAAIAGLRLGSTAPEILRAGLESVAFRFLAVLEQLVPITPVTHIVATGTALTASRVWPQILADVLGCPIALPREPELTSRGAAAIAFEQLGISPLERNPSVRRVFHPDARHHDVYRAAADRQAQLLRALYGAALC
ncbi:MAG TPA: gluconokinase [Vicinamibacterales bacterium]|nr:gluconokinase [Vicinamibacterales bacterium]